MIALPLPCSIPLLCFRLGSLATREQWHPLLVHFIALLPVVTCGEARRRRSMEHNKDKSEDQLEVVGNL